MSAILVIEDDAILRSDIAELLRDHGYDVVTAADGVEALAALTERDEWGVILLDMIMPNMDGREFRLQLLKQHEYAGIPVIFLSGMGDTDAGQLHAADVIAKPFRLEHLVAAVSRHCRVTRGG
jgi:CheY-like chemotaxis protein